MPTPSTQLALPQIAGTDTPDVPRDLNALIAALEANTKRLPTRDVLSIGRVGQNTAGRVLLPTDFTTGLGLSAPVGLYNLSGLTDASGNGRNLTDKGTVPYGIGISGAAGEAAIFVGSTAQALYRNDAGAGDPFRQPGTVGCWVKNTKKGIAQFCLAKGNSANRGWTIGVAADNTPFMGMSKTGTPAAWNVQVSSVSRLDDDRWHFLVLTMDGHRCRLYCDGFLEASMNGYTPALVAAPFNIGAWSADLATAASSPWYGRIDEAFVCGEVLDADQIRFLYSLKIAHAMTRTPRRVDMGVRRHRRGAALVTGDFPSTPTRLYGFAAGVLTDLGSAGQAVTLSAGTQLSVPGPDGDPIGAVAINGGSLQSTDTGLPATTASRSYGLWFNNFLSAVGTAGGIMGWGTVATADAHMEHQASGQLSALSGADSIVTTTNVCDGTWHFLVVTEENAPADGMKRKVYVDGKLVGSSTVMNSLTLAGANKFQIGALPDGTLATFSAPLFDSAFVFAGVLTQEQIMALYSKRSYAMGVSPSDPFEHVERVDATNVYIIGTGLDPQDQFDLDLDA